MKMNCDNCGKEFEAQRNTARFCSTRCRVAYNRKPTTSDRFDDIIDAIKKITEIDAYGDMSYERALILKSLKKIIAFQDVADSSSWWRCQSCWQAVKKEFPDKNDCKCKHPKWKLQKTML